MLDSLPLAEVIKAMRSISSQGTKMIHIRIPKLVTYGIQIYQYTFSKLSHKSPQTLPCFPYG